MPEQTAATTPEWATHWTALALAELPADLTTATPAQIDEAIRTLDEELPRVTRMVGYLFDQLHKAAGEEKVDTGKPDPKYRRRNLLAWPTTDEQVEAYVRGAEFRTGERAALYGGLYVTNADEALAQIDAIRAQVAEIRDRLAPLHDEFDRRGGWARYYRVANTNGHVHRTTACRETYATTQWNWPTQLSGADAQGVVEAAGALTCLTCFPEVRAEILADRPIVPEAFETREQAANRAEREAATRARNAKKIEKGITPDGSPLVVREPSTFRPGAYSTVEVKTARAGELRYVEFAAAAQLAHYSQEVRDDYQIAADTILDALAAKRGTTVEGVREAFAKKVEKKRAERTW